MAIETSFRFGNDAANFQPHPIRAAWIIEGNPVARIELLSSSADGTASTYFWDCTAGRFNWFYTFDETLHILQGSVTIKDASGKSRLMVPGDIAFFPTGSSAEWTVDTYVRKLAFCRAPLPNYFVRAKRIAQRLRHVVRGGAAQDDASDLL